MPTIPTTPVPLATPVSGVQSVIVINGARIAFESFDPEIDPDLDDVTSSDDSGWSRNIGNIRSMKGTMSIVWDQTRKHNLSPLSIVAGAVAPMIYSPDGIEIHSGNVIFGKVKFAGIGPKGAKGIRCTVEIMNQGLWTEPTT